MACSPANGGAGRGAAGGQWAGRGRGRRPLGCLALGDSSRVLMMAVNKGAVGGGGVVEEAATPPKGGEGLGEGEATPL